MSNRHIARSIVLQTLFELDSASWEGEKPLDVLARNINEFSPNTKEFPFMKQLLDLVLGKRGDIDKVIEKAAPEWPLDKIAVTARNILRIGLAELLFADRGQVPPKVAINEAIELGKEFGGESSGKFVNGVLGAVYTELGEPGKNDASKKKKKVAYEDMPISHLAGAVVYSRDADNIYLAFVHDIFGHWTISKTKVIEGEEISAGAIRGLKTEMNLDITIKEELGINEYVANDPDTELGKKRKRVTYFLAEAPFTEITLGSSGGLDDAQWFRLADVGDLNFYDDTLHIITKAIGALVK